MIRSLIRWRAWFPEWSRPGEPVLAEHAAVNGGISDYARGYAEQTLKGSWFVECEACAAKPGSPTLCRSCRANRAVIEHLSKALRAVLQKETPMTDPNVAALSPDDLKDLPEELLGELAISESERQDFLVLETLRAIAKIGTTDKIMVEHYKLHGVVMTRAQCQARLGRLVEKGLAHRAQMGQYYATNLDDPAPTFVDPRPEPDVSGQADPSAPPART